MKIVFIRHGEPDKSGVDKRGFIGQGRDMAPLTELGVRQAEEVSLNPLLNGGQIIVSSPYTRALQTAAVISKNTGLDIKVEVDLHEFIPDKTFRVKGEEENASLHREFLECLGQYPQGEVKKWETIPEIIDRTKPIFDKYVDSGYEKIIVVAHGGVIRRYTGDNTKLRLKDLKLGERFFAVVRREAAGVPIGTSRPSNAATAEKIRSD